MVILMVFTQILFLSAKTRKETSLGADATGRLPFASSYHDSMLGLCWPGACWTDSLGGLCWPIEVFILGLYWPSGWFMTRPFPQCLLEKSVVSGLRVSCLDFLSKFCLFFIFCRKGVLLPQVACQLQAALIESVVGIWTASPWQSCIFFSDVGAKNGF